MPRLENERLEQFARCLAMGTDYEMCFRAVGYAPNELSARIMASRPEIRARAEEFHEQQYPGEPYTHPTDRPRNAE